ncbi:MAG: glycosyltransferase family 4 protein [Ignavibacteriaceae bacterium]|nr:glycosyltransferase family 4 protein [Ignavibacteriaceae bacterium]
MHETKTAKIAILFQGSVLMPTASASRVKSYTEGLIAGNCSVTAFNMHPVKKEDNYDFDTGFPGSYDFNIVDKNLGYIKRKYYYLKYLIRKNKELRKFTHVFFYGESHFIMVYLFLMSRRYKIKLIIEGCEYPIPLIKNKKINKIYNLISVNILYRIFDAAVVISDNLYDYYKRKGRKNIKLLKVPVMVDPKRFENIKDLNISIPEEYIAYCGTMSGDKDGLPVLLRSMKLISDRFPDIKLLLIGDNSNPKMLDPLMKLILDLDLKNKVIFTGIVEKKYIPFFFSKARALVLARPDNFQSRGGFPTKLGEYLASGRPAIVTKVGEIQEYLTDGVTAYLAEAGSVENFAEKVIEALENTERSEMIAKKGKELAMEKFGIKEHGIRLAHFINSDLSYVN